MAKQVNPNTKWIGLDGVAMCADFAAAGTPIVELADSESYTWGFEKSSCTRKFEGPYAAAKAAAILIRNAGKFTDMEFPNFGVESVTLTPDKGNRGTLTVQLSAQGERYDYGEGTEKPSYEVDWAEIQKPIETHSRYASISKHGRLWINGKESPASGSSAEDDCDILDAIHQALSSRKKDERKKYKAQFENNKFALEIYRKGLRGTTHYVLYSPVVKATTKSLRPQVAEECGFIDWPPKESGYPYDYVYLKTADRVTWQKGKQSTRVQEWKGADRIDGNLYESRTGPLGPTDQIIDDSE